MRTKQSSRDPRRGRFATRSCRAVAISGELLNDGFSSYPSEQVASLAPRVLHYWRLLASPFPPPRLLSIAPHADEFYFRSEEHISTWAWLQNQVQRPPCFSILTANSGVGATTLMRHLTTTSGLEGTAVEISAAQWSDQTLSQFTSELDQAVGAIDAFDNMRTLWLIDVAPNNAAQTGIQRVASLANWYQERVQASSNLTVVTLARKPAAHVRLVSETTRSMPTNHLGRWANHELIRCIGTALRHAGGMRPVFTVAAMERLADAADGSIGRLGRLVHTVLLHGYAIGLNQISQKDVASHLQATSTPLEQAGRSRRA